MAADRWRRTRRWLLSRTTQLVLGTIVLACFAAVLVTIDRSAAASSAWQKERVSGQGVADAPAHGSGAGGRGFASDLTMDNMLNGIQADRSEVMRQAEANRAAQELPVAGASTGDGDGDGPGDATAVKPARNQAEEMTSAVGAVAPPDGPVPRLPHTFDGLTLPRKLGSYDLAAACTHATDFVTAVMSRSDGGMLGTVEDALPGAPEGEAQLGPHPSHRLYQALLRARDPVTNTVVITFTSVQYHPLVLNWLSWMRLTRVKNVLLLTLDEASEALLRAEDLSGMVVLPLGRAESLNRRNLPVFMLRYYVFTYALCTGGNVVMSDVDAIWLHNPIDQYMLGTPNDCVFSGDGMPGELRTKWNSSTVICFGFLFCRGNERALALAAAGEKYLRGRQDDQVAINYGLDELNISAPGLIADPPLPAEPRQRDIYAYYARSFNGVTVPPVSLTFTILARTTVTRHCGNSFHASTWGGQVAHCIVRQDATEKEVILRSKGLWRPGQGAR